MIPRAELEWRWVTLQEAEADPSRRALLRDGGLLAGDQAEEVLIVRRHGEAVATAARLGKVLRQIAVRTDCQGGDLTALLIEAMRRRLAEKNIFLCQVFTKPEHGGKFQQLGFRRLAATGEAVLMESGPGGLGAFREKLETLAGGRARPRGAIVMNANPFTLGHRHLIERALERCAWLVVIILEDEGRDLFPYAVRRRLVEEGCADLPRLAVIGGGDYVISAATFPSYFLKKADHRARVQAELDLNLFVSHLAPALGLDRRFAGEEPDDPLTAIYNRTMADILPRAGLAFIEIPRLASDGRVISASRVRRAFLAGRLDEVADCLPPSTRAYLDGPQAALLKTRAESICLAS